MGRPRSPAPWVVMSVRIPPSMMARIKSIGPWTTIAREAIEIGIADLESRRPKKPVRATFHEGDKATWLGKPRGEYAIAAKVLSVTKTGMVRIEIMRPSKTVPATKLVSCDSLRDGWPLEEVRWDVGVVHGVCKCGHGQIAHSSSGESLCMFTKRGGCSCSQYEPDWGGDS